jgi:hypothetical protein
MESFEWKIRCGKINNEISWLSTIERGGGGTSIT